MTRYASMAVFLLLAVLAAAAGATFEAGEWYYRKLSSPAWNAPVWLTALGWSVAYACAALAAWNAWQSEHYDRLRAAVWWLALLALNVAWSFLYFGINRPGWAWIALGFAGVLAIVCLLQFRRLSPLAGALMLPYLLWIAYLWLLNLATWTLNGGLFSRVLL